MRHIRLLCALLVLPFAAMCQISPPSGGGGGSSWNGGTVTSATTFSGATDTAVTFKAGSAQVSNILQILDNSGVLKTFVGSSGGFDYWFDYGPSNVTNFAMFSGEVTGDTSNRFKMGLDQGRYFISAGPGNALLDIGIERSGVNSWQITQGSGLGAYGNIDVGNMTVHGTCTNCGTGGATGITGPGTTVLNYFPVWNSTNGSILGAGLAPSGNGTKVVTTTGAQTAGNCVQIDANGNHVATGSPCGSGGGTGASMMTQIADFSPSNFTSTSMEFGALTTTLAPSNVTLGGTKYQYTNAINVTTTGTGSDDIYSYINPATGFRTIGVYPGGTNTYTCDNCGTAIVTLTANQYPAGSYRLYHCHETAGVPDAATSCIDDRPLQGETPLTNGYGTAVATTGGLTEIDNVSIPVYISSSSYTVTDANGGHTLIFTNPGTTTVTMPQAGLGNQCRQGWTINVTAAGGQVTFQPANSQIGNGATFASTYSLTAGSGAEIVSDPTLGANGTYDVFSIAATAGAYLPLSGGTLTGPTSIIYSQTGVSDAITLTNSSASNTLFNMTSSSGHIWRWQAAGTGSSNPGSYALLDGTNGGAVLVVNAATDILTFSKGVGMGVNPVVFSATPAFDLSKGNLQTITLTGNVTSSTISNAVAGQTIIMHICQDSTGSRTFVAPTAFKAFTAISSTANKCSVETLETPDGTSFYLMSSNVSGQ